jgi:hypothetical protein
MSMELVTGKVWARLSRISKERSQTACIAVAYFGKGAAKLLSLKKGSQLVVNASDETVKAGQTCPADLIRLQRRGVRIFNYEHLHAKIYVFGRIAAIGSANASRNSANVLTEAAVVTTERELVSAAKAFVQSIAKNEMGPDELRRLQKLYREPKRPSATLKQKARQAKSALPSIRVVNLVSDQDWSEKDWQEQEAGEKIAEKRRQFKRSWKLNYFRWSGKTSFERRQKIMMITREDSGKRLVDPPSTVLYVRPYITKRGHAAYVYVEHQDRRRRQLRAVAKAIGKGGVKRLLKGGAFGNDLSRKLYDFWQ